jgi:hypothetical protein
MGFSVLAVPLLAPPFLSFRTLRYRCAAPDPGQELGHQTNETVSLLRANRLMEAACNGNVEEVVEMLKQGADPSRSHAVTKTKVIDVHSLHHEATAVAGSLRSASASDLQCHRQGQCACQAAL